MPNIKHLGYAPYTLQNLAEFDSLIQLLLFTYNFYSSPVLISLLIWTTRQISYYSIDVEDIVIIANW